MAAPHTSAAAQRAGTPHRAPAAPAVTVVICAFTELRWNALRQAVASVAAQTSPAGEIVVVIDHNPALEELAARELPAARVIANHHGQGLSGARNSGIDVAAGDAIAFLDDDAVADPRWLEHLVAALGDPRVVGAGGDVRPHWQAGAPPWFPLEFAWVVGCSHSGMPTARTTVRNVIGASMIFRAPLLRELGGFTEGIGRVGSVPLGCEETELCIRAQQRHAGSVVIYEPAAKVAHEVPPSRGTWSYFIARCRAEGTSKALISGLVGARDGLAAERTYTTRTLPGGVLRGLRDTLRGDPAGLRRAAAIVAGLAATTFGYLSGRLSRRKLP